MLDDSNVLAQRDPHGALDVAAHEWEQTRHDMTVQDGAHDERQLDTIVFAGMGASAHSALIVKNWLGDRLVVPFEIVRDYDLPAYVGASTLVIASSYSGNTEEVLSCLEQARQRSAQVGIVTSGGKLLEAAEEASIAHVVLPQSLQPRMGLIDSLRGLVVLLIHFGLVPASALDEIAATSDWLAEQTKLWLPAVSTDKNEAKQFALLAVGKTPVFYAGSRTSSVAYKWKISWNENAKNIAFWNQYPEFNHNEITGWTSHPVEKPFVIFDLVSQFERPQILKRFEISDRLLSGLRPKANVINLRGESLLGQILWACILADFVSMYVAVLNGVDPAPVAIIEKLKKELV